MRRNRLDYVKRYYDAISHLKSISQHPLWQGSEHHLDNLHHVFSLIQMTPSIQSSPVTWQSEDMLLRELVLESTQEELEDLVLKIRGGEVQHTGVIPFLKKFEATVRSCTQNGVRGGSATVHFQSGIKKSKTSMVLKNNKGTEDNRVRKLDYSIQLSELFYQRFLKNEEITLFSPHDVKGLYEAFGTPEFDELYEKV